jgi:hypothetical protein
MIIILEDALNPFHNFQLMVLICGFKKNSKCLSLTMFRENPCVNESTTGRILEVNPCITSLDLNDAYNPLVLGIHY